MIDRIYSFNDTMCKKIKRYYSPFTNQYFTLCECWENKNARD